jgi:DNA-binding NtrC family response regulator
MIPAAASPIVSSPDTSTGHALIPGLGETILVVEDEDATREVLSELLGLLGYEVVATGRGEDVLAFPDVPAPDLLLTDVLLPGIPGPALAVQLRKRWPRLGVILMSGYTSDIAIPHDASGSPVRFLQKPFDMSRLSRELREALDAASRD